MAPAAVSRPFIACTWKVYHPKSEPLEALVHACVHWAHPIFLFFTAVLVYIVAEIGIAARILLSPQVVRPSG